MRIAFKILNLIILAAALVGCATGSPPGPTQPAATMPSTPAVTATDQPKNNPDATTNPAAGTPADQLTVTMADNNKTITLQTGDHFLLKLGGPYNWQVESSDEAVVSQVQTLLPVKDSQGLFTAHQPGQAQLTALGDPTCRSSKPACTLPSLLFQVNIVVK